MKVLTAAVLMAAFVAASGIGAQTYLINSDFNSGSTGWTITNQGTSTQIWEWTTSGPSWSPGTLNGTGMVMVDADVGGGAGTVTTTLTSSTFNGAAAGGQLFLTFQHYFENYIAETGTVEVFNGSTWQQVYQVTANLGDWGSPNVQTIDISAYKNANNQVRFVYNDFGNWGYHWAIDNVQVFYYPGPEIDVQRPAGVANSIPSGSQHSLGSAAAGTATNFVFTVQNPGAASLTHTATIAASPAPVNCTPGTPTLAASTAPGNSSTLTVPVTPTAVGLFSFRISIANNDTTGGENPYIIDCVGIVLAGILFYGGDFNSTDGLINGRGFDVPNDFQTFDNFTVPAGPNWNVTQLYANCLMYDAVGITTADWEIRTGMTVGSGGTLVGSGTGVQCVVIPTGQSAFGFNEYTVVAVLTTPLSLPAGSYYFNVRPVRASFTGRSYVGTTSGTNGVGSPLVDGVAYGHEPSGTQFGGVVYNDVLTLMGTAYDFSMGVRGTSGSGPTVTINQGSTQADPTSTSPIVFDVVFSAAVTGFATGDVTLGGTAGGTLVGTVSGSGTTYTVSVTGMTTSGTVTATIAAGVCTAVSGGQPNQASTSTDNSVQWNAPAAGPTVTINQGSTQADPTSTSPIVFDVVFSAAVTGFATGDVTLGGTAGGTLVGTVSGSGTTYTVSVTGMTTSGTVTATIAAGVCTAVSGGQPNQASTSTDNSVQWNAPTGPTVTINQGPAQADPTSTSPIVFDVVFSAAVTGFATGDVTLGGTAGGTLVGTVSGSGTTYTVSVTGMTTSGTVTATIAAGVCTAVSGGQPNQASTSTDNSVQWNAPASVLTIVTTTLANGTVGTAYNATITAQNGTGPYTWSLASGTLPSGLTLNTAATGLTTSLSGTPTAAGTFNFVIQIADSASATDTQAFTVTITSSGGGGGGGIGGGGGGGGCSADAAFSPWLMLLAAVGVLLVAARRRRAA